MSHPRIYLIAAIGKNSRALGKNNALLWRIPEDLRRFKEITLGHPVIMGSKTFDSIGKPLPGRTNIVLSDDPSYAPQGVMVSRSLEEALARAGEADTEDLFIIGGGHVYAQTIERADRLYLTVVDSDVEGDVVFPAYEHLPFVVTETKKGEREGLSYEFVTLERTT
jgi:dihydrofolate reductase